MSSQNEKVIEFIRTFGSIMTLDAFVEFGCTRLPARIYDLEQRGYTFKKVNETRKNRFGQPVTFTRYFLVHSAQKKL